jgi:RNA-directed DNA polymerase
MDRRHRRSPKVAEPLSRSALAGSHHGRWALSNTRAVTKAYPNDWFIAVMAQAIRSDRKLRHWFDIDRWIRLT